MPDLQDNAHITVDSILTLLGVIFTLLLFLGCFALGAKFSILEEDYYQKALTDQGGTQKLSENLSQAISQQAGIQSGAFQNIFGSLSQDQTNELMQMILPQNWVEEQAGEFSLAVLDLINLRSENLTYSVDLTTIKSNLQGNESINIANKVLSFFPDCTLEDVARLTKEFMQTSTIAFPACRPPEPIYGMVVPAIAKSIQLTGNLLPGSIGITGEHDSENKTQSSFIHAYRLLRIVMGLVPWGMIVVFLCILGVGFAGIPRAYKVMRRAFIVGGISAALGSGIFLGISWWTIRNVSKSLGNVFVQSMISMLGENILGGYVKAVLICSVICAGLGILLLLLYRSKSTIE